MGGVPLKTIPLIITALLLLMLQICVVPLGAQEESPIVPPPPPVPLERVEVQNIEFVGNTALGSDTLRDVIPIKPGMTVNPTIITQAIKNIEDAYAQRGYIAEVTQVRIIGTQAPRTLEFDIRETVVSDIVIRGLRRTRETVLRRFMDLKPGDLFNRRVLQKDIDRIDALGIFTTIQVQLEPGDEPGQVVVVYNVEERKTGEVTLGGSYGPAEGLVAEVTYAEANLFGRAQGLSATVTVGTVQGNVNGILSYYNPLIAAPRTDLLASVYKNTQFRFTGDLVNNPSSGIYSETHSGFQAVASRPLDEYRRAAAGLRLENVDTSDFPQQFFTEPGLSTSGSVLFANARYTLDRRLILVIPSSGVYYMSFLEAGNANRGEGGQWVAKLSAQRVWYLPLTRITPEMLTAQTPKPIPSLAIRASGGVSIGDLPFFEQFFLGGVYDLRGYRQSRFWGPYFVLVNTEYRHPLSRTLFGIAFVDVGDAWGSDFQFAPGVQTNYRQHVNFSPRAGAGVGLIWVTAFGTLRLQYAAGEQRRLEVGFGETF